MTKMNPEVKAKWVAALRSGKYEQCRDRLNDGRGMCCLGVLCDVYDSSLWRPAHTGSTFINAAITPPHIVGEWAGIGQNADGEINPTVLMCQATYSVAFLNDEGKTFAEIADAIEAQL